jgi:hypothetical protein
VAQHVTAREFDAEWILLDLERGKYFGLDELGGQIWDHLRKGRSPGEIADLLRERYEVEGATLLRDVIALTDDLLDNELVVALSPVGDHG